jgi:hypothetical protein
LEGYLSGGTLAVTGDESFTLDAGALYVGQIALLPAMQPEAKLVYDGDGVVATLPSGAVEARGRPSVVCMVGPIALERATCDDRGRDGVIAEWIDQTYSATR